MQNARSTGIVGLLLVAACSKPSSDAAARASGTPSAATVAWSDGGGAEVVVEGARIALPSGDLAPPAKPAVTEDEGKKRLAVPIANGEARLLYKIGDAWFVGGTTKMPIDMRAAPDLDHAYEAVLERAKDSDKKRIFDETTKAGADATTRLLVGAASVDTPEWDTAFAALPPARADEVKGKIAAALDKGGPVSGLRRAVVMVPLRERGAPALAARIDELTKPVKEPRAVAAMLRALAAVDRDTAAKLGCATIPAAKGDGNEALLDAALFAVANAALRGGPTECKAAEGALGDELCLPFFRCGEHGPLAGTETTKQDEPLCTKPDLAKALERELDRPAQEIVAMKGGTRPPFYAFAWLVANDKVPAAMTEAHARRRFPITQPKEPSCENGTVAPGTACHAEESTLRYFACAHEPGPVQVGVVRFKVDEKAKKISDVVASLPP